jgi:hypothetical protein
VSFGEAVQFYRDGTALVSLSAAVDPRANCLYLDGLTGVLAGDLAVYRGFTRRVVAAPELWQSPWTSARNGSLIQLEAASPFLPDVGVLARKTSEASFDAVTGVDTPAVWVDVWSGACSVEAAPVSGMDATVAEQQVGVQPFTIMAPLALADVRPDDKFTVSSSRDLRLLVRTLTVTRVAAGSSALVRTFTAIDNQG